MGGIRPILPTPFLEYFLYFDRIIPKGFWKKNYHAPNTAAHTPKTGLQRMFTASSLGHTRLKLEMNVPQKTHQVDTSHLKTFLNREKT